MAPQVVASKGGTLSPTPGVMEVWVIAEGRHDGRRWGVGLRVGIQLLRPRDGCSCSQDKELLISQASVGLET